MMKEISKIKRRRYKKERIKKEYEEDIEGYIYMVIKYRG